MSALRNLLSILAERAAQLAPRERALLACMAAIGSLYLLLAALDWSASAEEAANAAHLEQLAAERRAEAAADTSRQDRLASQVGQLREWAYSAQTQAIARVEAQTALRDLAQTAGMTDARVTLDPAAVGGDVAAQTMVLEGRFSWRTLIALSNLLAQTQPAIYVNGVTLLPGREPRLRLTATTILAGSASP